MPPIYGGAAAAKPPAPMYDLSERFSDRARALFYARLAFLGIGLGVLAVPKWAFYLGATSGWAFTVYFAVIGYSVTNYLLVDHPRFGRSLTYVTLNLDLVALTAMTIASGGLASPLMAGQVMFTIFFALLYPKLIAMVPPMIVLFVVALVPQTGEHIDIAGRGGFLFVWYFALDVIGMYVLIHLRQRDDRHMEQLRELSSMREMTLVTEERLRLSREIHDGLGGTLSTLIIQAEFLLRMAKDPDLKAEIIDLKGQAEEAIEELRRSLTMMRRDFDLHRQLDEYCARFEERSKIPCPFKISGLRQRLPSEMQLAIFRILQECLTNIGKHSRARKAEVRLKYDGDIVSMTISDDGVGFDTKKEHPGHYGLINLRERVKKYRGTLDFQSALDAGTTIHATLVIPEEGSHIAILPGSEG